MEIDERRHTGLWPFSLLTSGLWRDKGDSGVERAQVFDPVALTYSVSSKFTDAGWIGLDVMPSSFLYRVLDADKAGGDVSALIEDWIEEKKDVIAAEYERRIQTYSFDELALRALREALLAYRAGSYLSVVRTLMPEFERLGRMVILADGSKPMSQKQAVRAIQDYLSNFPAGFYPPIESLAAYSLISEDLFASCFTEADALALSNPNRHAELHGLASYGDLRGATKVISAADFMVSIANRAATMAAEQSADDASTT